MNSVVVAITYAVVGTVGIAVIFMLFKTQYEFWEVALAALVGAALSFMPTVGGIASLAATLGVLFWRIGAGRATDIFVAVGVARLLMVPVLLVLNRH
jgi:hypothetical protein